MTVCTRYRYPAASMLSLTEMTMEALLRCGALLDVCDSDAPDPVLIVFGQSTRLWRVLASRDDIYDGQE